MMPTVYIMLIRKQLQKSKWNVRKLSN